MIDTAVVDYLQKNLPDVEIYPIFTLDIDKTSIAYKIKKLTGGFIKQAQVDLNIMGTDFDEVKLLEDKIISFFDTEEKQSILQNNYVIRSNLSGGGGCLFREDLQLFENHLIFIIKYYNKEGE